MSNFRIEHSDGSARKVSGYKAGKPKPGSKFFKPSKSVSKLPPRVDLRKYMTEIEHQDELNSCTANAVAGAYEYLVKRHQDRDFDVSRLYIYYNARYIDDAIEEDEGAFLSSAIESLKDYGACSEETWPYDIEDFDVEPSEEAYDEGSWFLVEDFYAIEVDLNAWKQALAEGYPIIFGLNLYSSFDSQKTPGKVPDPTKKDLSRDGHGAHAMLCVGYSDTDEVFIVRNSWGDDWGDDGYCYISYDYMMNPDYNMGDSWVIRQVNDIEEYESAWGDDSSITGDYDTELAEFTDEEYEEMLEAMGDYPLETRIALIILTAAASDGDVSDEEIDEIHTYLQDVLEKLGVDVSAKKVLKHATKLLGDEGDLLEESITLLGEYLSNALLAKLISDTSEIIGVDDLTEEEEEFIDLLTEAWQIEE